MHRRRGRTGTWVEICPSCRGPLALGSLFLLMALCGRAAAQGAELPARRFGLGTAIGSGYAVGAALSSGASLGGNVALEAPSLEMQFFTRRGHSIDISVPVTNTIIVAAVAGIFAWSTDVFYNFNLGRGRVRGLLGPGLGAGFAVAGGVSAGFLRVPVMGGVEFLSPRARFGFKIRARPFFDLAFGTGPSASVLAVGGGAFGELVFSFYGRRP